MDNGLKIGLGTLAAGGGGLYLYRRGTGLKELQRHITTRYRIGYHWGGIRVKDIRVTNQSRGRISIRTPQVRVFSDQAALDENRSFASSELSERRSYEIAPFSTVAIGQVDIPLTLAEAAREIGRDLASGSRVAVLVQTLVPVRVLGLTEVVTEVQPQEISFQGFPGFLSGKKETYPAMAWTAPEYPDPEVIETANKTPVAVEPAFQTIYLDPYL